MSKQKFSVPIKSLKGAKKATVSQFSIPRPTRHFVLHLRWTNFPRLLPILGRPVLKATPFHSIGAQSRERALTPIYRSEQLRRQGGATRSTILPTLGLKIFYERRSVIKICCELGREDFACQPAYQRIFGIISTQFLRHLKSEAILQPKLTSFVCVWMVIMVNGAILRPKPIKPTSCVCV